MAPIVIIISSSMSSLSTISPSLQDEIKQIGHVFFVLFLLCTLLVVVGVVLEEIKLRAEKSYIDAQTGIFIPEKRRTFAKLGLWLLVIGIAGEGAFEIARSWTDGMLQNVSDALLLNAEAQTGNAARSARTAHDEADAAKSTADTANRISGQASRKAGAAIHEADSFEKDIVSAKNQAADAESHLAEALQRAANAELELARIKTPRSLNLGQQERVAKALSQFARQPFALMVFSDGESIDLATEINGTLKGAQWERVGTPTGLGGDTAINIDGVMAPTVNVSGIRLWAGDDVSEAAARALQKALSSPDINIPSGVGRSKFIKDRGLKLVVIEVGQKQI